MPAVPVVVAYMYLHTQINWFVSTIATATAYIDDTYPTIAPIMQILPFEDRDESAIKIVLPLPL